MNCYTCTLKTSGLIQETNKLEYQKYVYNNSLWSMGGQQVDPDTKSDFF